MVLPQHFFETIKRDIGKPTESRHESSANGSAWIQTAPYEVGGFKYGAAGMSAIILRYLKKQAVRYFKKRDLIATTDDTGVSIQAVVTVPAYFGETMRQETRLAAIAAGFSNVTIINEPTAAALAYGLLRNEDQVILVFDLGGGTFDVTVLRMRGGRAEVMASRGDNALGGKDFDELIVGYLFNQAERLTGRPVPIERALELEDLAVRAKHELSSKESTEVAFTHEDKDLVIPLFRRRESDEERDSFDMLPGEREDTFFFEERATDLLNRCRALCESLFDEVTIDAISGPRKLLWRDIDQVVLVGGSCRMPMVPEMLERLSGRTIHRQIEGVGYSTAVAIGAALYGVHRERVRDVLGRGIGLRVIKNGRPMIERLLAKDTRIPASVTKKYRAVESAVLEVFEGDSESPEECELRGSLELDNEEGTVQVALSVSEQGLWQATVEDHTGIRHELEIRNELFEFRDRAVRLGERVKALRINL